MENMENSHSATVGKLFEALAKAQGKIESALKDKRNPFFKSSYADLSSVWDACRLQLSENGLAIIQTVEGSKENMVLVTWLGHNSGEWIKSRLPLIVLKHDPQSLGSAITYARRYALSAMVGICADEDDDGEKAMNRKDKVIQMESPKELEKNISEFVDEFPENEREMVRTYFKKYCNHWKKTSLQALEDYADKEKFAADFSKWRKREESKKIA